MDNTYEFVKRFTVHECKTAITPSESIVVQGVGSGFVVVKALA